MAPGLVSTIQMGNIALIQPGALIGLEEGLPKILNFQRYCQGIDIRTGVRLNCEHKVHSKRKRMSSRPR